MKAEHTATPWNRGIFGSVVDSSGDPVRLSGFALSSSDEANSNDKFIIAACNAHEELIDALMSSMPFIEDMIADPAYKNDAASKQLKKIMATLKSAGAL